MLIDTIVASIIQLFLFCIIPFLWWFISARKNVSFLTWIGLKQPELLNKGKMLFLCFITFLLLTIPGIFLVYQFEDKSILANAKFASTGLIGFISILFYSFIQTSLSEEIIFRGFLNKRLSNKFGFVIGNSIQSILFGLMHGVALFLLLDIFTASIVTVFTAIAGYVMGYVDEKISNGSIIPSWLIPYIPEILYRVLVKNPLKFK